MRVAVARLMGVVVIVIVSRAMRVAVGVARAVGVDVLVRGAMVVTVVMSIVMLVPVTAPVAVRMAVPRAVGVDVLMLVRVASAVLPAIDSHFALAATAGPAHGRYSTASSRIRIWVPPVT